MNTTIRNCAAALGVAALAGFAGVASTGGSALAATGAQAEAASSSSAGVAVGAHSDGHPTNASGYADELVRVWGAGSEDEVSEYATPGVVEALAKHDEGHAAQWTRIAADGTGESSSVVYKNKATEELLTFVVDNEAATHGYHPAVHHVRFKSHAQPSH